MLGVGRPVVPTPIKLCPYLVVVSVISIRKINMRKEKKRVTINEGEEVESKWTEKEG